MRDLGKLCTVSATAVSVKFILNEVFFNIIENIDLLLREAGKDCGVTYIFVSTEYSLALQTLCLCL